ncbi:hypothetical protein CR513_48637, partial [Mucuna pruriens]
MTQYSTLATHSEATSTPAQPPRHPGSSVQRNGVLSIKECKLGTEKPKVTGGDQLEYQRTLKDLILSVLATRGEPSPSAMAIVVEDGTTGAKSLSSTNPLYAFDPEIELTLRRLQKIRNTSVNTSSSIDSVIDSDQFCTDDSVASSNIFTEPRQMENQDRTLKELATPDVVYQPWCIQYPQLELAQTYELKSGLIHLRRPPQASQRIPRGLFHDEPQGFPEDYIKMKAFPFSLDGAAKDWLYLQPTLFNTWGDMKWTFLEKFFPASRTATIRKEICGIRQHTGETLHEYLERFNKLYATCPHH